MVPRVGIAGVGQSWRVSVMPDKAATDLMRTAMQASGDYNAKIMEFAAANTHAAFEYFRRLQGAKSPSEVVELTTTHMREQTEILTAQAKQLAEMAQKLLPKMGDFRMGDFKIGDFKGFGSSS
jgi:Phasin protein